MIRAPEAFTVASELAEDIIRLQQTPEFTTTTARRDHVGRIRPLPFQFEAIAPCR
jgi:hypothetical protein